MWLFDRLYRNCASTRAPWIRQAAEPGVPSLADRVAPRKLAVMERSSGSPPPPPPPPLLPLLLPLLLLLLSSADLLSSAIETVNVVDFCGQTIRGDGMIINSHQESKKYYFVTMATDCHLTMQASSPKDKVQFHFRFFLVYSLLRVTPLSPAPVFPESPRGSSPLNPRLEPTAGEGSADPCHAGSYLQFYDGRDRNAPPLGAPLCGKSLPRPVLSTGSYLTLRLVTRGTQPRVDFVGDFTSFRLGSPASLSLLVLYVALGVLGGSAVLCWCCWSPGWFLWRISICRFLPCCNYACASCQLCVHSKEHRLAKVTPQAPAAAPTNGMPAGPAAAGMAAAAAVINNTDENVTNVAV